MRPIVFLLTVLLVIGGAEELAACQCGLIPPPVEAAKQAAVVFAGTVSDIRAEEIDVSMPQGTRSVDVKVVKFDARHYWKGLRRKKLTLIVGLSNCDFSFTTGATYFVYATPAADVKGSLTATICLPTKLYSKAGRDKGELGKGEPVVKDGDRR